MTNLIHKHKFVKRFQLGCNVIDALLMTVSNFEIVTFQTKEEKKRRHL